ncbi:hypothetical protein [Aquimarina longa]|uniref:hypothetical protein n=1 Tax=Aquimarina longa TaxID=1080221 RepID=UPI000781FC97|nr:hypothetical protein [Aquimarina longa]
MKKSILNVGKALSRIEQKQINGGGDGPCSVYVKGTGWIKNYSVEDAQFLYDGGNDSTVTGYCCASCR